MSVLSKKFFQRTIRVVVVALLIAFAFAAISQRTANAQAGLKVQYRVADPSAPNDNQIKPHFQIVNGGTSAVSLSTLKIRYYFTKEAGASTFSGWCDYAVVGCGSVTVTVSAMTAVTGADSYIEVGFTGTGTIAAGGNSGEIQTRVNKTDWSNFAEAGDYSYDATKTAFADWTKVVLLSNGTVVWGTAPGGTGATNPPPTNPPPTVVRSATCACITNTPVRSNTPLPTSARSNTPVPTQARSNTPLPTIVVPTNTPVPTTARSNTPVPTVVRSNTPVASPIPGTHLANPFVGANIYKNVDYVAEVNAAAAAKGGTLGAKMAQVSSIPTFIWLDSIDAVNGTNGYGHSLAGYMDSALAGGFNAIEIVIYDLPNRDCSALASNGELLIAQDGFNKYKTLYIDPIYNVISQAKYANLRVISVIEPDSLPNLVTNLSFAKCQEANGTGGYVQSTQYTLNKLHPVSNFYAYIDIGHAGWLGWDTNFTPASDLIANTILATTAGGNSVDGFISNTANTSVVVEPYLTANQTVSGNPVRSANFYQWNLYIDEAPFDAAWKAKMVSKNIRAGMLVDTSRNGWGGCGGGAFVSQQCRPTATSTSTDLNTMVNASRTDRRPGKGDWCNQDGAGLGARPAANPGNGYDAYVWVKPPGESDGSSSLIPTGPNNPGGKGFDRMCDPTYGGNALNNNVMTNALAGAPVSGRWFEVQFEQLVTNAFPALP